MNHTTYIDAADVAKLIRKALREAFAGVRFTVRTSKYAGGASIDVGWMDGPSGPMVESVINRFSGSSFDGMTDCKSAVAVLLDGERVHFGADFVFTQRTYSDRAVARGLRHVAHLMTDPVSVEDYRRNGFIAFRGDPDAEREFNAFMRRHTFMVGRQSPTAGRVTFPSVEPVEVPAAAPRALDGVHFRDGFVPFPDDMTDEQREAELAMFAFVDATVGAVRAGRAPLALVIDNAKTRH